MTNDKKLSKLKDIAKSYGYIDNSTTSLNELLFGVSDNVPDKETQFIQALVYAHHQYLIKNDFYYQHGYRKYLFGRELTAEEIVTNNLTLSSVWDRLQWKTVNRFKVIPRLDCEKLEELFIIFKGILENDDLQHQNL
jgi:hypothetical protein